MAAAPDVLRSKESNRRRLSRCQFLMSFKLELLSSVAHKADIAAGSVEYPDDDGTRCAVSTGVLPASGCTFSAVYARGISRTACSFRQQPGCKLQLVKAYLL